MGMTAVVTNVDKAQTSKKVIVNGTITLTGNYGTSGGLLPHGDTLDFSGLGLPVSSAPKKVSLFHTVTQGSAPAAVQYQFNPGTGQADGIVQISVSGTEVTPGSAYASTAPTNATGYVLNFQAEFWPAFI